MNLTKQSKNWGNFQKMFSNIFNVKAWINFYFLDIFDIPHCFET